MNRRSFIKLSGLLGLGLASGVAIPAVSEAVRFNNKMIKVSKTKLAMGTFVSMTLLHPSKDQAEEAMGRAFIEVENLCHTLTRFEESAAIAQLNKEGRLTDLPAEVFFLVDKALHYYRISNGAFDISVKPVVDLFKEKLRNDKSSLPSEREIKDLLKLVDSRNIDLTDRSIRFLKPGMGITLDGIAPGYIVDRAAEILTRNGIENFLINGGGEIITRGSKDEKKPWTVAIQDPQKKGNFPDTLHLRNGAISTSGNYEVYFDQEKIFHHIIDPRTGLSPRTSTSVSVLAGNTMEADAFSTAVFVMGPSRGTRFIESLPLCESFIMADNGMVWKSKGWKSAAT